MKSSLYRMICRLLVISIAALPFPGYAGGLVSADAVVSAEQSKAARDRVLNLLTRTDVQQQLQTFGLASDSARDRVNAMSDSEVLELAGRIDSLPAGADSAGVVVLILIVVLIWWIATTKR